MNTIERNNKRHQEALDVVAAFKADGGVVKTSTIKKRDNNFNVFINKPKTRGRIARELK